MGQSTRSDAITKSDADSWVGRWRFRLRELFIFILILACGLVLVRMRRADWAEAGLFVVSIALAIGLSQQARAISGRVSRASSLTADTMRGWRIAAIWRWGVAFALVGYWLLDQLRNAEWISLKLYPDDATGFGVLLLCIVLSLFATPWGIPRHRSSSLSQYIAAGLSLLAAGVILWWMVRELMVIPIIVFTAIERASPGVLIPASKGQLLTFVGFADVGISASLLGTWLIVGRTRRLPKALSSKLIHSVTCLCLLITVAYVVWVRVWGLCGVSACMAEGALQRPWHSWLGAGVLISLFAGIIAYRSHVTARVDKETPPLPWRRDRANYWNEHPVVLLLLCVTCVGWYLNDLLGEWNGLWNGNAFFNSLTYTSTIPQNVGIMGLGCMSAWGLFRGPDQAGEKVLQASFQLHPVELLLTWLFLAVFIAGGIEAITWFGFGLCALLR